MNTSWHRLFPDALSDAAARACESRFAQIQRHHRGQHSLYNPQRPWLSPPAKEK